MVQLQPVVVGDVEGFHQLAKVVGAIHPAAGAEADVAGPSDAKRWRQLVLLQIRTVASADGLKGVALATCAAICILLDQADSTLALRISESDMHVLSSCAMQQSCRSGWNL